MKVGFPEGSIRGHKGTIWVRHPYRKDPKLRNPNVENYPHRGARNRQERPDVL